MRDRMDWAVEVRDDSANTFEAAAYALNLACGLAPADALAQAEVIDSRGATTIATFPTRDEAERLAVDLQVLGLRAAVRTP